MGEVPGGGGALRGRGMVPRPMLVCYGYRLDSQGQLQGKADVVFCIFDSFIFGQILG